MSRGCAVHHLACSAQPRGIQQWVKCLHNSNVWGCGKSICQTSPVNLRPIHIDRKRKQKQKLSLMFVVYSLTFFAFLIFFTFTTGFSWCEQALTLESWRPPDCYLVGLMKRLLQNPEPCPLHPCLYPVGIGTRCSGPLSRRTPEE